MDMLSECKEVRQRQRCRLKWLCATATLIVAEGLSALSAPSVRAAGMACVITPYDEISIGTPVEGLIQTVPVERGDWVSKGQVILTLGDSLVAGSDGRGDGHAAGL